MASNPISISINVDDPVNSMTQSSTSPKVKRGRRSKKEIAETKLLKETSATAVIPDDVDTKPIPKKRGRKPKGGKIVEEILVEKNDSIDKPNVMLHLKCYVADLNCKGHHEPDFSEATINSYDENSLNYHVVGNDPAVNAPTTVFQDVCTGDGPDVNRIMTIDVDLPTDVHTKHPDIVSDTSATRDLWKKLKALEQLLHINSVPDSKSACFWCSYEFDNPPIYIPKFFLKSAYHVYGCFCSPECATAHLMKENIDSSSKFERYSLLNSIYNKVFGYTKNIKPAPDPHYLLGRFCGNLTIQEYRALLKSDRLFLVVDKPLTRILPELHEDNDEFIINNKIIPTSNNFNVKRKIKNSIQKANTATGENFGIFSMV